MKTLNQILGFSLMALAMGSCRQTELVDPEEKPTGGIPISIECEMQGYTKATDTAFEEGDAIGVYVYRPEIHLENGQFSYINGKFSPDNPYMWYDGYAESDMIAYYPYKSQSWGKEKVIDFCVNADQRTHDNYTASDLMIARMRVKPSPNPVVLPFEHVLSKVLITINNQLDEDIAEVAFTGVKGSFKYDVSNGNLVLNGKEGIVKAAQSRTDKTQWAMILPPQTADPTLVVITAGQKEYKYNLPASFKMESGKCHCASIKIDTESISTEISTEIKDWLPGNDFNFGQETVKDEWVSLGMGTLIDDAVAPVFGLPVSLIEVEVFESTNQTGVYKVVDPYKSASFYNAFQHNLPGELVFEVDKSAEVAHLRESNLGLVWNNGELVLKEDPEGYGGYWDESRKLIRFYRNSLFLDQGSSDRYYSCSNGFFCLVLPGGYLPEMDRFSVSNMYSYTDESGVDKIKAKLFVQMKYQKEIFYKFYDYKIDPKLEYRKYLNGALQMAQLSEPKVGMTHDIEYTPGKSSMYSIFVVGKNMADQGFYDYNYCTYVKEGETIPEPTVNLTAIPNPNYPEGEILLNVKIPDEILYYTIEKYAPVNDESQVQTEILNYAPNLSEKSPEGAYYFIPNLKPSTEYKITVKVRAIDNSEHMYEVTCTTSPESSYTLLGEGTFIDNTQFAAWDNGQGYVVAGYESPVLIYQDNNNPNKFRMMNPYKKYWENSDPNFIQNALPLHNGNESPYVDFYRYVGPDGRTHVGFSEIDLGQTMQGFENSSLYYGALGEFKNDYNGWCYDKSIEWPEGVFNLNPVSTYIRNANRWFGLIDYDSKLQIILPKAGDNPDVSDPSEGIPFDYFEVPQTLKESQDFKYIIHHGETYSSHKKVRNYSACYDTRRHNPMWVAYPCHDIWWEGGYGRPTKDPWRPDPQMEESEQSIIYASDWSDWPWSYNGGNPTDNKQYWTPYNASFYFTKGHLLRSAERGTRDKYNLFKMNEQTFYPTNISPERYPTVRAGNKKVTHWGLVEGIMPNEWRCSDTLYVVAGCYYGDDTFTAMDASDNGNTRPGSKDCVVPVARWKVFLRTKSGSTGKAVSECRADELMAIAFWFPQSLDYSNMVSELLPLAQYTLSVNELEAKIGGEFNFFPQVPDEVCNSYNASDWPKLNTIFNVKLDANYNGAYIY